MLRHLALFFVASGRQRTIWTKGRRSWSQLRNTCGADIHVNCLARVRSHVKTNASGGRLVRRLLVGGSDEVSYHACHEFMVSAKKTFKRRDLLNVNERLEFLPERAVSNIRTRQDEIIDIHGQEKTSVDHPVTAGMPFDSLRAELATKDVLEMALPMCAALGVAV